MGRFRRFLRRAVGVAKRVLPLVAATQPKRQPKRRGKARGRTMNPAGNRATIIESVNFGEFVAGKAYAGFTTLTQCVRAANVARNFQEYKCTRVEWEFQPYNTVYGNTTTTLPGSAIGLTLPQMLYSHQPNGYMLEQTMNYNTFL